MKTTNGFARRPQPDKKDTAYVERHNLTIRMSNRRFNHRTNAFSNKLVKHEAMVHLFAVHYSFCRIHAILEVTPAREAGIIDTL